MTLPLFRLPSEVLKSVKGQYLEAFLISFEGWRRGLDLTWYKEGSDKCSFNMAADLAGKFFSLNNENHSKFFYRTRGEAVSNEATTLVRDKEKTKQLLKENNLPVPLGKEFNINELKSILEYSDEISYPVVLKPVVGYMGRAVFCDLKNEKELKEVHEYFTKSYPYKKCIIEKQYYGDEHRIYVVGDEVVSAINRKPAHVIGDGTHTIQELIDKKNEQRKTNPYLRDKPIKVDYELKRNLKDSGLELDEVYSKGTKIELRKLSNLARGGEPHDVTDTLSDSIKELAVQAIKSMPNMSHGGVDIIVDEHNISKGVVLEINATAEIVFHMYPVSGTPQDIPSKLIDFYFPETIGCSTSNYYYDFVDILQPLANNFSEKVIISQAPIGKVFKYKYEVSGEKSNFGFLKAIKSLAVKANINGEVTKISDKKVEILLKSSTQEEIDQFLKKFSALYKNCELSLLKSEADNQELMRLGFFINR